MGKLILLVLRLFGRRGSSFPGMIVERVHPSFLAHSLDKLPYGVIVVSGTNGKTTTTKMVAALVGHDQRVLTNPTGANFTRGVVSSVIEQSSWSGHLNKTAAVLELDEAYAVQFVEQVPPRGVLLLNVMRDQMDRFGEIDHTARMLGQVAAAATEFVVLNAGDRRVRALHEQVGPGVRISYFGVGPALRPIFLSDDELYGAAAHLGDTIDSEAPPADYRLDAIDPGQISIHADGTDYDVALHIFGSHNALNATAAFGVARQSGVPADTAVASLEGISAAFGRGEFIDVGERRVLLQLVKNPGGFRHSLLDIGSVSPSRVLIVINDDYADGRDVSWLWDVDFRALEDYTVATSGTRADDMTLRLAYDGITASSTVVNLRRAMERALEETPDGGTVAVCATYTAMFAMRKELAEMTDVEKV